MPEPLRRHVFHARVTLLPGVEDLVPASDMLDLDPEAHRQAMAKYDDTPERRRLRDTLVPGSGRRWTEFVFLSPVHPHAIWSAWREIRGEEPPRMEYWAIPAGELPAATVVVNRTRSAVGDPIHPAEVTPFDAQSFVTADVTPAANREWLTEMARRGMSGGWFHGIPHVLAPGRVPLASATVVAWEHP